MAHWGPDYPPFGGIGSGHIAYHKMKVGWIPSHRIARLLPSGDDIETEIVRLADSPETKDPVVVLLPIDQSDKVYYTVEARKYAGEDSKGVIPSEGVVIHRITKAKKDREASI